MQQWLVNFLRHARPLRALNVAWQWYETAVDTGLWHTRPLRALYVAWQWYLAVVGALLGCYRSLHALYVALQWLEAVLGCARFAMVQGSGWRSFLAALVPLMLSMWLRSG